MDQTTGRAAYLACRDMLVRHRDDYDAAIAAFRWPEIGDRFGRGTGPRANHFGCAQDLHRSSGGMGPGSAHCRCDFRPCPPKPSAVSTHPARRVRERAKVHLRQDPAYRPSGS